MPFYPERLFKMTPENKTNSKWSILKLKIKNAFAKKEHHHLSDDELIDEALEETFPASDPPGYRSKTHRDKELHQSSIKH